MQEELDPVSQPGIDLPGDDRNPTAFPVAAFPVVGVGASAGGLEAFTHLLQHLPADTGLGFVFVQHLSPHYSSQLAPILSRATAMPVMEARQKTRVEPNHVYVIPPNTLMRISGSVLELAARPEERGAPRPIDYFFQSLAQDCRGLGIGVILSGSDSDGALGLQAIREEGGIAIVQTESSAKNPEMPRNAAAGGTVDLVLSPEEIGGELVRISRHPAFAAGELRAVPGIEIAPPGSPDPAMPLHRIFQLLRGIARVDFSAYKPGTLRRRIARRMLLQRHENFAAYLRSLETDRAELVALSEDVLIHVTSFFRDTETFGFFESSILPRLLKSRAAEEVGGNTPFRVWVPGCATGEEVYSIAICLIEAMATRAPFSVQIFGTDLSEQAIAVARNGVYPDSDMTGLSPERQARFFVRCEGGLQIVKSIREMCVFARQNLLADPPFSRLDLISCRNVLIYLGAATQRRVISTFHYALQPEGCLWLGHSESPYDSAGLFSQINAPHKFYSRIGTRDQVRLPGIRGMASDRGHAAPRLLPEIERRPEAELERAVERVVASEFGPAWVLVNENFEIVNSRGNVSAYLRLPPGGAVPNLMPMARDEIREELGRLLDRAKSGASHIGASVPWQGSETRLEVRRLTAGSTPHADETDAFFLVVFFPAGHGSDGEASVSAWVASENAESGNAESENAPPEQADTESVERLRLELTLADRRLRTILGERDAANQELTSAYEEIQSRNEELQSINEELETSKEELQSSNEELNTVNEELRIRNRESVRLNDDLANLLSSTTIPILMLDNDLRIRRATPAAERLFHIRQTDVGRPIGDMRLRLGEADLDAAVRRVIDTLAGEEIELPDREGRWHVLRIRPYRTADNRIEGAVLAMIDIDQMRRAQNAANAARDFAEALIESVQTPLLVLNRDLRVRVANRAFLAVYDLQHSDVENRPLNALGDNQWNSPELSAPLGRLSRGETFFEDLESEQDVPGSGNNAGGKRIFQVNARQLLYDGAGDGREFQILMSANDITAQRRAEKIMLDEQERLQRSVQRTALELEQTESALHGSQDALQRSREELRALTGSLLNAQDEERRRVSRELHDDVGQSVAKLQFDIETLEQSLPDDLAREKKRLLLIRDGAGQLSDDLRKIAYALHPSTLDHLGLTVALRAYGREFTRRSGIRVEFTTAEVPARLPPEIASSFYRITQEALRNVAKHAEGSSVVIRLTGGPAQLTLTIRDNGPGFDPEAVRGNGGLGLISMKERARLIRASFRLETQPGNGAALTVSAPLA